MGSRVDIHLAVVGNDARIELDRAMISETPEIRRPARGWMSLRCSRILGHGDVCVDGCQIIVGGELEA